MKIFVINVRKIIFALCIAAVIPIIFMLFSPYAPTFNVNGREIPIYSVERSDSKIALTFDCAWNDKDIDSILSTLDKYKCTAAFFVTGDWAEKYPNALKKIHNKGHIIGNHSYNHADYTKLSANKIIADLDKCDAVIANITGEKPYYMRAPSGGYNDTVVKAAEESGRMYIQWSVDSLDYTDNATEESILQRTMKTGSGDIVLMHNGTKLTSVMLPKIISELSKKYEFASLDELVYKDNYTIDNAGRQHKITEN